MERPVLNNPELEAQFQKEGYVVVDFMSREKAERLKQKFLDLQPHSKGNIGGEDTGFEMPEEITYDFTFIDKNTDFKRMVYDAITEELDEHKEEWLKDYKIMIANYIRKKTDKGEVPIHQNWSFADEQKCCTVSIWCPLVDATKENGTLQVVPGSHKRFGAVRGPMVPWELEGIKDEVVARFMKPIEIPAGKAVILDDSIVHYSAPNTTDNLRLAIQLICIPKELPSLHYYMNPMAGDGKVEILEVDKDFYIEFNPWKAPTDEKRVGTFQFQPIVTDIKAFESKLYGQRYDMPAPKTEPKKEQPLGFFGRLKAALVG